MGIVIKRMETDGEIRGKAYVAWRSWHEAYPGLVSQDYLDRVTLESSVEKAYAWRDGVFVAKDGDRVVGFVCWGNGEEPGTGELVALYILSEYYGTGLAQRLMETALEQMKDCGRIRLWCLKGNGRAVRFYEKCGFYRDGTEKYRERYGATIVRMTLGREGLTGKDADAGDTAKEEDMDGKTAAGERKDYAYITLRERPELMDGAAEWFHAKWSVPKAAYLECMECYLKGETEYGWYLCLDGERIVGGMGVIENDFHDRKDLAPNVCAVYTEEDHRCRGIAGHLLDMVVEDMRAKGISPLYLNTDHTGFYERYGWEFFCMVQGDGEPYQSRLYIHR